jgi:hypothetical protein
VEPPGPRPLRRTSRIQHLRGQACSSACSGPRSHTAVPAALNWADAKRHHGAKQGLLTRRPAIRPPLLHLLCPIGDGERAGWDGASHGYLFYLVPGLPREKEATNEMRHLRPGRRQLGGARGSLGEAASTCRGPTSWKALTSLAILPKSRAQSKPRCPRTGTPFSHAALRARAFRPFRLQQ